MGNGPDVLYRCVKPSSDLETSMKLIGTSDIRHSGRISIIHFHYNAPKTKYAIMMFRRFATVAILMVAFATLAAASTSSASGSLVYKVAPYANRRRCSRRTMGLPQTGNHYGTSRKEVDFDCMTVQECSAGSNLAKNLVRGAFLRIASDLSGGTPLETLKCRVTVKKENMVS